MSMIKGKLEATREVSPRFSIVGESKFARQGDKWIVQSEPNAHVSVASLDEAFFESTEKRNSVSNEELIERIKEKKNQKGEEMNRYLKVWRGLRFFKKSFQGWYVVASYHHPDSITWRWSISFDPRHRKACWPKLGPGYYMGKKFFSPSGDFRAWIVLPWIGTFSLQTQQHMFRANE